ncbi:MAG: protein-L-isoaspartate(D-aspartate) O-methyltransferase [Planctomycetaceae bacterium]
MVADLVVRNTSLWHGGQIPRAGSRDCRLLSFSAMLISLCMFQTPGVAQRARWEALRENMVQTALEAEGISNPLVLEAMRAVPRHEFVRSSDRARGYDDSALPIGYQQTISPPYVVAYMTEVLDPSPEHRVLEIGTGSGYQASVLGQICKEVYTIEIVPQLAKQAARRLQDLEYTNIEVRHGDGYLGWEEHAPFDRIIVTCSPENVPQPLVDQLKEGGRMIIPVGERYQQAFHLLTRVDGKLQTEKLISTLFVPMTGESEDRRLVLPNPRNPVLVNGSFDQDENEDGRADGWHYQRNTSFASEDAMDGDQYVRFENQSHDAISQALQGMAIDGRVIGALALHYWVRHESIVPGPGIGGHAGIIVHFYDSQRRELGSQMVGRWRGTLGWQDVRSLIAVPPAAREMIIRIGLNNATGSLDMDHLRMVAVPR